MPSRYVVIFMTCPSRKAASKVVDNLLKKRIIACANIVTGVDSIFRWKGRIEKADEALVIMKSKAAKFSTLEKEIRKSHPYEIPEIIALPVIAGYKPYLKWVDGECGSSW